MFVVRKGTRKIDNFPLPWYNVLANDFSLEDLMTLFNSKNEFKFTLFYAIVLLVSNILVALLYLPVSYMQSSGTLWLIPIYYLERLFDLWLSVFSIAAILVIFRTKNTRLIILAHIFPIVTNLIYQAILLLFNLQKYHLRDALLSQLFDFIIFVLMHLVLTVILHIFFIRGNEGDSTGEISFGNSLFLSNLITVFIFFTAGLVMQIIDTVTFINEDLYGVISFATPVEIFNIIFNFVFLAISAFLAFLVMNLTEKKVDRYLKHKS